MFNHDCFVGKLLVEMGCFIVSLKFNGIETESIRTSVDQSDRPGVEIRTIMNRETDTGEKILLKNPFQLACIFSFFSVKLYDQMVKPAIQKRIQGILVLVDMR